MTKKIGVLRGTENSFPEALIARINEEFDGSEVVAEQVTLDAVRLDSEPAYDVILDRVSHDVPFYRSYLKWAALQGVAVINNPFWASADDTFIDATLARALGITVPKSVILPHKHRPARTEAATFRNLRFPIDWTAVFSSVGFPAVMQAHDAAGRRGATLVHSPEQLFAVYDASGTACMMVREAVTYESTFRCTCIGRRDVLVMRTDPGAPAGRSHVDVPQDKIPATLKRRLERDTKTLCKALGTDLNAVEFGVRTAGRWSSTSRAGCRTPTPHRSARRASRGSSGPPRRSSSRRHSRRSARCSGTPTAC